MGDKSAIQWTDATWNPLAGCTPVSDGCRNCYAASMALRLEAMGQAKYAGVARRVKSDGRAVFTGKVNLDHAALEIPLGWKRPRRIFVNSMSDLFHEAVPDHFILEVFAMMERCPQHIFQVLTKRPERMADWVRKHRDWIEYAAGAGEYVRRYGHVWCGTSVEHQAAADERIPWLLHVPARIRFLSCEPLLGAITFRPRAESVADMLRLMETGEASEPTMLHGIHWLIAGAESGHGARPMDEGWVRGLRDQCQSSGTAFFYKQNADSRGHKLPLPLLDGRRWTEMPS